MVNETEIKLDLGEMNKDEFINACLKNYPKLTKTQSFQRDTYYDTLDMQLQSKDFVVRVRENDNEIFVALKSPRVYLSEFIQKRIELEFRVANLEEILKQVESQRLKPIAIIEKKRITLKADEFTLEVDELPYIGSFVEIESESLERIEEIYERLPIMNLRKVKENYGELLDKKLEQMGLPLRPNLKAIFPTTETNL